MLSHLRRSRGDFLGPAPSCFAVKGPDRWQQIICVERGLAEIAAVNHLAVFSFVYKKKKVKINSVDKVVLLEMLFRETQASEGQASGRVSGEKLSPYEDEPEFGAAGFGVCPRCVAKDSKETLGRPWRAPSSSTWAAWTCQAPAWWGRTPTSRVAGRCSNSLTV